jgi:hypothetical protein
MAVGIHTYLTQPLAVESLPENGRPLDLAWDGLPSLRGLYFSFGEPAALPTLWLELFWAGGGQPAVDWQLRFRLLGPEGKTWLDSSQPLQPNMTAPWPSTGLARRAYALPVPAGTPPGTYELLVQPWNAASGASPGGPQKLASLTLAPTSHWPLEPEWPFAGVLPVRFATGLELIGLSAMEAHVRPGHPVLLSLYWRRNEEGRAFALVEDLRYKLEVVAPGGEVVRSQGGQPGPDWLAPGLWPAAAVMVEHIGLYFPPETAPGRYLLRWRLVAGGWTIPGRPAWRPWSSDKVVFGLVQVDPWPLETRLPAAVEVVGAWFGQAIELYGYALQPESPQPGGILKLTLYWQAKAVPQEYYVAFVHLLDRDETIVRQSDRVPVNGLRPTTGWRRGEVLADVYELSLPADIAPGPYRLAVGLYNSDTLERLPVTYSGELQPDNRLLLATITVAAASRAP